MGKAWRTFVEKHLFGRAEPGCRRALVLSLLSSSSPKSAQTQKNADLGLESSANEAASGAGSSSLKSED